MTAPLSITSLLPGQVGASLPAPQFQGLSDAEQHLVSGLSMKLSMQAVHVVLRQAYYDGTQRLANLGVSIPPQLANVRTVVDWPRAVVEPLIPRATVDGFRMPGSTDVDTELAEFWQVNDLDAEAPLAFLDSLVAGRGYMIVGSADRPGGTPVITVESPLNLAMNWDPRTRRPTAVYQAYEVEGVYRAVLYLPDVTVTMSHDVESAEWVVEDRDEHGFGDVPVRRMPNRQRTSNREGASEISPAIMATTDSAVRSLLGMEIAREVYCVPRLAILGASESDFVAADGTPKTALDMAMTKVLALERDEEGQLPVLQQLTAFDPSVFTKVIDQHAKLMASYTGYPPDMFGLVSQSNPASADSIRMAENGLVRRAQQCQRQWSGPLEDVMRLSWRFANGGAEVPKDMWRLETDWEPAETPTPAGTTDAVAKQVQVGAVPATSDVTLKRLGYSAVERERLVVDRKMDVGAQFLAEVSTSMQAKQIRVGNSVVNTADAVAAPPKPAAPGGASVEPGAPAS